MNLVFPALVQTMGDRLVASHAGVVAGAAFMIVLGAILSIMGCPRGGRCQAEAAQEVAAV
jgi:hypothetical protein